MGEADPTNTNAIFTHGIFDPSANLTAPAGVVSRQRIVFEFEDERMGPTFAKKTSKTALTSNRNDTKSLGVSNHGSMTVVRMAAFMAAVFFSFVFVIRGSEGNFAPRNPLTPLSSAPSKESRSFFQQYSWLRATSLVSLCS
jgi:hypothetical protein